MKIISAIALTVFSQITAFSQNAANTVTESLASILPPGDYQLITAAVKPENEVANPIQTWDVKIRYEDGKGFLDYGDSPIRFYTNKFTESSVHSITFTIPPSEKPHTWFVTSVFLGRPSSEGVVTGQAWFISHSSVGMGIEQTFSLTKKNANKSEQATPRKPSD